MCDRYGFAYYREWVLILDGWARRDATGVAIAQRGIDNLRAEGALNRMPYWLSLLADCLSSLDRKDARERPWTPRSRMGLLETTSGGCPK